MAVSQVIPGGPAEAAGFQPGDVIERYDDARVLGTNDLRTLSSAGEAGDSTAVDVIRGSEEVRLYLPRGPLGIRLDPIVRQPEPVR